MTMFGNFPTDDSAYCFGHSADPVQPYFIIP